MIMVAFTKKKLTIPKRICIRLKELRESKHVSIAEMEKRTRIHKKFIIAMEECRFSDLPKGIVYQKNFVREYLAALEVDPAPLLRQFLDEEVSFRPALPSHPPVFSRRALSNLPTFLRIGAIALVIFGFIFYIGLQVKRIIEPPRLTVVSPYDGYASTEPSILVNGTAGQDTRISINGKEVTGDDDGRFETTVILSPGMNTVTVTAEKKHGKKTTETRYVILREKKIY